MWSVLESNVIVDVLSLERRSSIRTDVQVLLVSRGDPKPSAASPRASETAIVELFHEFDDLLIQLGKIPELTIAQSREDPSVTTRAGNRHGA
jgi:hypothetical protein